MYKILKNTIEMDDYSVQKLSNHHVEPEPFEWNTVEGTKLNVDDCIGGKGKIEVKGNTYQAEKILPEGYTQVDYIESHGEEYIDTGVNADSNLRIILDMAFTNPTLENQNVGAIRRNATSPYTYKRYHLICQSGIIKINLNTGSKDLCDADSDRHVFDFDIPNQSVKVDKIENLISKQIFDCELDFRLFGRNSNIDTLAYLSSMKLWKSKMYASGVLVRDFIPCYRNSDNEVGLYDIVNNVFYTNQGTGAFTYGSVVTLPNPDFEIPVKVVTGDNAIKHVGKNLLNFDKASSSGSGLTAVIEGTNLKINGTSTSTSKTITDYLPNIYKAGTYVFSITKVIGRALILRFFDDNNETIRSVSIPSNGTSASFTLDGTEKKYRLIFNPANGETYDINIDLQLEKGTTATPYEEHREEEYEVNLGTMELCKKGDYEDVPFKNVVGDENYNAELESGAWYKKGVIGKQILNGTENWTTAINRNTYNKVAKQIQLQNAILNKGSISNLIVSQHFRSESADNIFNNNAIGINCAGISTAGYLRVGLELDKFPTDSSFKEWLAQNNDVVRFPVQTPTYEKITDPTLISQLEALNKAKWFKGVNHIWTETENIEPVLEGTYRQAIAESGV